MASRIEADSSSEFTELRATIVQRKGVSLESARE